MEELFVAILSMLLVVALIPLYMWKRRQDSPSPDETEEDVQVRQRDTVVRATGTRRMRRRPASAASTSSAPLEETVDGSDDEAEEGEYYNAKASKKKEKKRQDREAQRQVEEAAQESRYTKQDRYAEMRRRKDEEREARERQLEEEAMARKAKEEEAAALEFEKWKGEFSVDGEGTTENEVQDGSQGLLFDFVEYIKKQKCVPLEDLAAEFKLRTQECINRITSLENMDACRGGNNNGNNDDNINNSGGNLACARATQDLARYHMLGRIEESNLKLIGNSPDIRGDDNNKEDNINDLGENMLGGESASRGPPTRSRRLSGVMDDRGKYIYISLEEMKAVADYIKRQGRVSISHLASKSNQFIDLEPKAQFVEEISTVEEITAT
ncbi:hypothetical protein Acr_23g0008810 [Actinidia rufa]|uniref:DDRGK domain-containing protein 1 n=1 Tax=Actinidia rufa TaxID=165716 RepID=A0A7J0GNV3_9ERIC|nr:hypothetical protein Acr_23g0008810 [Actinidia rufa]